MAGWKDVWTQDRTAASLDSNNIAETNFLKTILPVSGLKDKTKRGAVDIIPL